MIWVNALGVSFFGYPEDLLTLDTLNGTCEINSG